MARTRVQGRYREAKNEENMQPNFYRLVICIFPQFLRSVSWLIKIMRAAQCTLFKALCSARENLGRENYTFSGDWHPFNLHILFNFGENGEDPLNTNALCEQVCKVRFDNVTHNYNQVYIMRDTQITGNNNITFRRINATLVARSYHIHNCIRCAYRKCLDI